MRLVAAQKPEFLKQELPWLTKSKKPGFLR